MPAQAFTETIARVSRSASRDETRPILTGILVSAEAGELRMVATDSYRLSVKETALEQGLAEGFEANVPARALDELGRLVTPETEQITIGVRTNQVVFSVGETRCPRASSTVSSRTTASCCPSSSSTN